MIFKINMVCPRSPIRKYGGIEQHVWQLSNVLIKRGYEIKIYATNPNSRRVAETDVNGITIKEFPSLAPQEAYYVSIPLLRSLKKDFSNIIHVHGYTTFPFIASAIVKNPHQKLVGSFHSAATSSTFRGVLRKFYGVISKHAFSKFDRFVCVSEFEKRAFTKLLGNHMSRVVVIENAIDDSIFKYKRDDSFFIPIEMPYILSICRLEKGKGLFELIRGFFLLKDNRLKLVIVGSGPAKVPLTKLVQQLGIEDKILFLERLKRKELIALYKRCKIFVHLSRYESSGIAVLEAIACKKPTLLSINSVLSTYVNKGWAIGLRDLSPQHIADTIELILSSPQTFLPKSIPNFLSWNDVANKHEELYRSLGIL